MLKSQGRRNLTTVHGQQNFDHANQPSSFQRMTNVGLYASEEKPSLRQSTIWKYGTSIGQISQCFQLSRISQLSAGRMRLHVVDVQHGRVAVGSLKGQDLTFHSWSPQTASLAIRCHAYATDDT